MITAETAELAHAIHRRAPLSSWEQICNAMEGSQPSQKVCDIPLQSLPTLSQDLHSSLLQLLENNAEMPATSLGAALRIVQKLGESKLLASEPAIAWTGPSNGLFPVRRSDQILYDLIHRAKDRILLVTFAAVKIEHLVNHLEDALRRNINVTLILESKEESEGQLSFDAANAFTPSILSSSEVLVWPLEKRKRNARGKPGKLHVKCAVVDDKAIISSANLTEDAFNHNMEMGLVVEKGDLPGQIYDHFSALKQKGVLVDWSAQ